MCNRCTVDSLSRISQVTSTIPSAFIARPIDIGFLQSSLFWILQFFNVVQGVSYFLPPNYLPFIVNFLGFGSQLGLFSLMITNLASVVSRILTGFLINRLIVTIVILVISIGATIFILTI